MRKVKIFGDSTLDLGEQLCNQYQISIIPLTIILGGSSFKDIEEITPAQIFEHFDKYNELPKTAAINSEIFKDSWAPWLEQDYDIVHFGVGSDMSACYTNAVNAAKEIGGDRVHIVDTKNLSTGSGLLALYACDLAKEGLSAAQIAEKCSARTGAVQASFVIDKLNYLYKGGRCSSLSLFAATALSLKPGIKVKDGKMVVGKKYVGRYTNIILKYVSDIFAEFNTPDYTRVFVTYTATPDEIVQKVVEKVKKMPFKEVLVTTAGSTISSHCGPNTLGVLFINDGDKSGQKE